MILALTTVGVYAVHNSIFEVWMMLGFGAVGYAMEKLDIPTAPAVLAVILGPMAEASFRRALLIGRGEASYFVASPISWVLIALIAMAVLSPAVRAVRERRARGRAGENDGDDPAPAG